MSGPKVVELPRNEPLAEVVDECCDLLVRAQKGEFNALVIVAMRPDQTFAVVKVGKVSDLEVLGCLEFAKHDVMRHNSPHD